MYSARTYYNILRESKTEEEYKEALVRVLTEMFDATIERIERGGKNVINCVLQMNQKWDSIRAIADNNPIVIGDTKMVLKPHGFMHSFSEVHKEYGFDYKKFCEDLHLEPEPDLEAFFKDKEKKPDKGIRYFGGCDCYEIWQVRGDITTFATDVIEFRKKVNGDVDTRFDIIARFNDICINVSNNKMTSEDIVGEYYKLREDN